MNANRYWLSGSTGVLKKAEDESTILKDLESGEILDNWVFGFGNARKCGMTHLLMAIKYWTNCHAHALGFHMYKTGVSEGVVWAIINSWGFKALHIEIRLAMASGLSGYCERFG